MSCSTKNHDFEIVKTIVKNSIFALLEKITLHNFINSKLGISGARISLSLLNICNSYWDII